MKPDDRLLLLPDRSRRAALMSHSRMSTKWPSTAAAAAICGLTRCVRPPRPWRPSKLRFDVEAQRSPGCRMSGFMPRHIEQPASRHSKPGLLEDPVEALLLGLRLHLLGAGHDHRAHGLPRPCGPRTTSAAARRSSIREFVHEPMNTRSTAMSSIAVPGSSAMYASARSAASRSAGPSSAVGIGHAAGDRRDHARGSCPR